MNYIVNIKTISFVLLTFIFLSTNINAQSTSEYKAENEGWLVKIEEAYKESKATGKPIMANFTGSDWCGYCIKLTNLVFSKPKFKEWAKDNVVLLELDFPRRHKLPQEIQQQNYSLQKAFDVKGYPTVWIFDLERDDKTLQYSINALGKTGYTKTAKRFISDVEGMIAQRNEE